MSARLASPSLSAAPQRPQVVLVDDDVALRMALEFSLDLEGFDVTALDSGEALLRIASLPLTGACLVLDQNLPGMTGVETLRQLRARGVTLPALLITSHPPAGVREAAQASGARIVEKPLLGDALTAHIVQAIGG
ncbi:response regulator [Phenylobacterium aquaticum]|uniref:response regulator n=1 Tax=Phenylobacterium aquaticum TaxID=1763816 RepID=UPI0026F1AE80|nr:response regulator [Phenylobacterium aquaticum]